jgi:acyl-CoA thioesterase
MDKRFLINKNQMADKQKAEKIVGAMYDNDAFSQWMGIKRIHVEEGACTLEMKIRDEMTNGFKLAHGGIIFSFADSALAFACNSLGRHAVSIEASISNLKSVFAGDVITAKAKQLHSTHKVGFYQIDIFNQNEELVGSFKGTVYRSSKEWEI